MRIQIQIYLTALSLLLGLTMAVYSDYTVSGTFKYQDLQQDMNAGFTGVTQNRPVRYADVLVMSGSTTIAQGATDENGFFSINVTTASPQNIQVVAVANTANTSFLNIRAGTFSGGGDPGPTHAYPLYSENNHDPNSDVDAGEVVATYHNGGDEFNLFDVSVDASLYLSNVLGEPSPPGSPSALRVAFTFSPNGTNFAFYSGTVNMDGGYGYDDAIMLHEIGHWVQDRFGDFSDNTGGQHFINDNQQNPRLSFGEGWPTFWGSHVRAHYLTTTGNAIAYHHPSVYMNSNGGIGGGQGFAYNLETIGGSGAASEIVVQGTLWDMTDNPDTPDFTPGIDDDQEQGFYMDRSVQETWDFVTTYLSHPPFNGILTYEDWYELWIANIPNPQQQVYNDMQRYMHRIEYFEDDYEPNNTMNEAVEVTIADFGQPFHNTTYPQGDEDWYKFIALKDVGYQIETLNMLDGADTFLRLYNNSGTQLANNDNITSVGGPPNALGALRSHIHWVAPADGEYFARITRSTNNTNVGGGNTSKYGNWDFSLRITTVPPTFAAIQLSPGIIVVNLGPNASETREVIIRNNGTVQALTYEANEYNFQADSIADFSWLSLNPSSGSINAGGKDTLTVNFNTSGISTNTSFIERIRVSSNDILNPNKFITIILNVTAPVGIDENEGVDRQIPAAFALHQNFPNPFNPETNIQYELPEAAFVSLNIFNVRGQEVRRLLSQQQSAGVKQISWNSQDNWGKNVPSGIYFYQLQAGNFIKIRKMILLR